MIICVAVDDNMGMTFNRRRQSQDRVLREHLLELAKNRILWMNNYSARQFNSPLPDNIMEDADFWAKAGREDLCFVENTSLAEYQNQIEKIILFKWNRIYPADTYFDIPLGAGWILSSTSDFEGNSHTKITMEEWNRENI